MGFVKESEQEHGSVCMMSIYFKGEAEGITVEVAFQYTNEFHENVLGFCNNIFNAEGGTHHDRF